MNSCGERPWRKNWISCGARKDYAGLQTELQEYKKLLTDTLGPELKPFAKSDLFVEMFGNPEFTKAYRGAPVNNLDWIFGNLMKTADGIWIIDYEWTFPVQVPIEYLIWRAVSLYQYGRNDLASLGLMTQTGISPEEERQFEEMEHHFQRWLLDGTVTIGEQYLATAGRTLRLETLLPDRPFKQDTGLRRYRERVLRRRQYVDPYTAG